MAYIASTIAYRGKYKGDSTLNNIFAFALAGTWMTIAYLFAGTCINHFYLKIPLNQSFIVQSAHIPGSITQILVGIVISVLLIRIFKKLNISLDR